MEQLASNLVEKDIPVIHSTSTLVRSVPDAALPNKDVHTSNSFSALGDAIMNPIIDISVNPVIETRMARAASQGVAAVTKALLPRQRQQKKKSNSSSETLWDELILFSQALLAVPWLVGGDFNDIRSPSERSDGASISKESLSFHDKLNAAELHDIPSSGTNAEFLPPGCSDHCAGLVGIQAPEVNNRRRPFKFFNFWIKNEKFLDIVKQVWETTQVQEMVQVKHDQVQKVATPQLAEESFYRQKSRIKWLQEGDSNTTYFYKVVKVRRGKSVIKELYTKDNKRLTTVFSMENEAVRFYQELFGTVNSNCTEASNSWLKYLFNFQLPVDMANSLIHPVTEEEIKVVVFSSPGNRSPGPNGFTAEFYKAAWSIVGDLGVKAIKEFFSSGQLLKEVNSTIISLVPKI
ncbi:hypothetical protein SLEP1_g36534 [Rubroshorea leprosula]|uniref:Uncharacterized protein n=1 Tax=Rubroshorea leprosula TaxID=152421 RepID=A0AAV5KS98_9ROSI|nr:hypothetical protein SLEP1_g36534 [Rubroshorea leprosula]